MNALFRHLTVRLWLTAFVGGWISLTLLPWWQQVFGLHWLVLPATIIFGICFVAGGWAMSRIGMALALRQVQEAAVWERAGMIREAERAYQHCAAFFDSFWLSPVSRRSQTRRLSGALARFYLSHFAGRPYTRALAAAYLKNYPQDEAVAQYWLEGLIGSEHCSDQEHETVTRIGQTLERHQPLQRLVMQFYLANGRIDFDAQQTYRRVWEDQQPLAVAQVQALADLLLNESIVNPWALQVYLKAYQNGQQKALEGIAACLQLAPHSDQGRDDLIAARQMVAHLDAGQLEQYAARFKPTDNRELDWEPVEPNLVQRAPLGSLASKAATGTRSLVSKALERSITFGRKWLGAIGRRQVWYALAMGGAACLVAVFMAFRHPAPEPVEPETPVEALAQVEKAVVTDPFTIQVAAYLKSEDAQRVVDQLTQRKLDAFWTKATSANRTWYQVKVSHFPSREAAQRFGQDLKAKGVIDDFYVANYEPR